MPGHMQQHMRLRAALCVSVPTGRPRLSFCDGPRRPPGALRAPLPLPFPACHTATPQPWLSSDRRRAAPLCRSGPEAQADSESQLQEFLSWAVANGVQGVDGADSRAAIFEGEHGERGLACIQDIAHGDVVLRVPLRLAITEHAGDEESNSLVYPGAAWSVRLASKLLRMCRAGSASPWAPYLRVLPRAVPSPHTTFSWEEIQEIQYEPMLRDFDHATWVASTAQQRLSAEATGGAGRDELDWALAVVHSRSFGSPGQGGSAVRMLVPVVDMLNHAGDEYEPGRGGVLGAAARDNVRWDLEAPEGPGGEWSMKVSATRDIQEGEELLLSYGERSNDSFFQHYGFVPPRNPHDDVTLWDDIPQAVAWLAEAIAAETGDRPDTAALATAVVAANSYSQPLGPAPAPTSQEESEVMAREAGRVRLLAGARLDGRLMAAYDALASAAGTAASKSNGMAGGPQQLQGGGQPRMVPGAPADMAARQRRFHAAVAARCQQVLEALPTSLLQDLERLAAWEASSGSGGAEGHGFEGMLQQYRTEIEEYCRRAGTSLDDPFGSLAAEAAERRVEQQQQQQQQQGSSAGDVGSSDVVDAGAAALGVEESAALQGLLQQLAAEQPLLVAGGAGDGGVHTARGGSLLPVIYRCYKKMILWDAVLAAQAQQEE